MNRILILTAATMASLAIGSCAMQIDADMDETITFYDSELWEVEIELFFDRDLVESEGFRDQWIPESQEEFLREFLPGVDPELVEVQLNSHRDDGGNLVYRVHLQGKGLQTLKYALFDENTDLEKVTIDGNEQIVLSHTVGLPEALLRNYTLTIAGGKIISSNGLQIGEDRVRWRNPSGTIEAVFTAKSRFGRIAWIVGGLALFCAFSGALLTGVFLLFRTRRSQKKSNGEAP